MAFGQFNFRPEGRFVRIRCDETTSRKAFEGMPEVEEAEGDGAEDGHGRGDEWMDEISAKSSVPMVSTDFLDSGE